MADFNRQNALTAPEAAEAQSSQPKPSQAMASSPSLGTISRFGAITDILLRQLSVNAQGRGDGGADSGNPAAIHMAAFFGDAERVLGLLAQRPELLAAENNAGNTALHLAAHAGRVAAVEAILEFGRERRAPRDSYLTRRNRKNMTPLHVALKRRQDEAAWLLAKEHPYEIGNDDVGNQLLIQLAAEVGNVEVIRILMKNAVVVTKRPFIVEEEAKLQAKRTSQFLLGTMTGVPVPSPRMMTLDIENHFDEEWTPSTPPVESSGTELIDEPPNRPPQIISKDLSKNVDSNAVVKSMEPKIYAAAVGGHLEFFKTMASEDLEGSISNQVTPQGRTVLHIATTASNSSFGGELVTLILQRCPNLLTAVDHNGDTALHLAASIGNLVVVKALIRFAKETLPADSIASFLTSGNGEKKEDNTALHVALKNYSTNGSEVARFLAAEYPKAVGDSSLLYLAAVSGDLEVVKELLEKEISICVEGSKSPVHAAIKGKNLDILDAILSKHPSLMDTFDESGRRPLSFAARSGNLDFVLYMLDKFKDCAYKRDNDNSGSFPIHATSSGGHKDIVAVFLQRYPDMHELLTHEQRNILHVSADRGRAKVVKYLLERKDELGKKLVNEGDEIGNTPLHLASKSWHPKVVNLLTWNKRVRLNLENKHGLTALDIARESLGEVIPFRQRLTLAALKSAGVPRSIRRNHTLQSCEPYKARVNTLLLVATLVATVTFACSFTIPGGNDNDSGAAKLLSKPMFQAFLICNTISMYSSIFAVVILIAAQLEDAGLILTALKAALPLIGLALTTMSFAFTTGVYIAARRLEWLAILLLVVGSAFTVMLVALYLQLCAPLSSRNLVLRHLFYHSFCLMVWATGSDSDAKRK